MLSVGIHCCLPQIVVGRAHTVDGQMDLLLTIGAKMVEEPYKLLIVDSIMALFRSAGSAALVDPGEAACVTGSLTDGGQRATALPWCSSLARPLY